MKNFILFLVFLSILTLGGCNSSNSGSIGNWLFGRNTVTPNSNNSSGSINTPAVGDLLKVNVLFSLFMVATVIGIIVGLAGFKVGWLVAGGNLAGIILSLTVSTYGKWLALAGLIAAVSIVAAMLWRNRQFQVQSVNAVEQLKSELPEYKEKINDVFWRNQNRTTEKIVQGIKSFLEKKRSKEEIKEREKSRKNFNNS